MEESTSYTALSVYDDQPEEGALSIKIYINGKELDTKYGLVSAWIRKEVNKIGKAELNFKAWSEIEVEESSDSESKEFTPGNSIRIEAGYMSTTSEEAVFEGIIISQNLEIDQQEDAMLKVECRDYMYLSTLVPKTNVFTEVDDKKIANTIIGNYSPIEGSVTGADTKHNEITQYNTTDWDFLIERIRDNGLCIITEGKKMTIDKPVLSGSPVFKFTFGDNIVSVKGKMQASQQLSKVQVLAWNSKEQKLMRVVADKASENDQGDLSPSDLAKEMGDQELTLQTSEYTDDTSLKKWAEAKLQETNLKRIQGDVVCKGTAKITVGSVVEVEKVGRHFDGTAYCGAVEHEMKDGGWLTTACMGYPDDGSSATGSSGKAKNKQDKTSAIKGLQIGKVVQIDKDPSKEYNIQVEVPLFESEDPNKVWARLSTFWASDQYGAFFLPDVGDEVILGFLDDDPNKPVILGSMYSSKLPPANTPDQKNNIRSIVTKSQMKLEFEEEKKSITLITPGKNSIEISDDGKSIKLTDQNSNKIEMTDSGIVIESAKGITLKAKTDVTIDAGTSVDIKGKSAVNLKGANIEAKADIAFTGKGSASAELSAGGQTVVKGAMVMIN